MHLLLACLHMTVCTAPHVNASPVEYAADFLQFMEQRVLDPKNVENPCSTVM